jgi:hypothetical protein
MNEARLIAKLQLIEALFSGAATKGERVAAERARERILERLELFEKEDPPREYRFSMGDMWSRKVFTALLRRYGITPYRYKRQRYTTVMAKVSKKFVDETLWPEFLEFSDTLESYLADVTDRVVAQVIHQDSSDAEVVDYPLQLPGNTTPPAENRPSDPSTRASPHANATAAPPVSSTPSTTARKNKNRDKRKRKNKRKRR